MYPIAVSLAATSAPAPPTKAPAQVSRAAQRYGSTGLTLKNSSLAAHLAESPEVSWAPGGVSRTPLKKQVVVRLPIPKRAVAFVLPQLPAKPKGGYKFGKAGFEPLPPMTVVPHALGFKPVGTLQPAAQSPQAAPKAQAVAAAHEIRPAADQSYPLTALSEKEPLNGVNRPIASVIQELATREHLKVLIGPTEGKTITVRLSEVEPEVALRRVTKMAGLSVREHEGVWYVATPDWMTRAFPERLFTKTVRLPTDDAESLAKALQKVLGGGTEVQALGGNHLVVRAPINDLETTAHVLAQWPEGEGKTGPVASLALDLPDGMDESLFRVAAATGETPLSVEPAEKGRSFILRGTPTAVLGGLKSYVAALDHALLPASTVARRTEK